MGMRILVIDDEEDILEVIQASLEVEGGFEVMTASSGRVGLANAIAERPDAILLDVMMPGMDGRTTFQKLRANAATRHIPVVLLTAKVQSDSRHRVDDLGVTAVISKPFDPLKLASRVLKALAPGGAWQSRTNQQTRAAVARIWGRHKEAIIGRLEVLEQVVIALQEGALGDQLRRHAEQEAHKLVGSAATFGFAEGSRLAREAERMLGGRSVLGQAHAQHLSELVVALYRELEGTPSAVTKSG